MQTIGQYLSDLERDHVEWTGVEVEVRPGAVRAKAGVTPFRSKCLVEPAQARDMAMLKVTGPANLANVDLTVFTFAAGVDVKELDEIHWNGFTYKLENAPADTLQGERINVRCLGTRLLRA